MFVWADWTIHCVWVLTDFVHADDAEVEGVLAGHRRAAGHCAVVEVHGIVRGEVDHIPRVVAARDWRITASGGDMVDLTTTDLRLARAGCSASAVGTGGEFLETRKTCGTSCVNGAA